MKQKNLVFQCLLLFAFIAALSSCAPQTIKQTEEASSPTSVQSQPSTSSGTATQASAPTASAEPVPSPAPSATPQPPPLEVSQDSPANHLETVTETPSPTPTIAFLTLDGPLLAGYSDRSVIYDVSSAQYHELPGVAKKPIAWSPDGCYLLYQGSDSWLYMTNISHFTPQVVVHNKVWADVVWSPTGEWIAYDTRDRSRLILPGEYVGKSTEVHVVNMSDQEDIQLTDDEYEDYVLGWTADASEIIIWSERENSPGLFAINIRTKNARLLVDLSFLTEIETAPTLAFNPVPALLSPDRTRLLIPLQDLEGWPSVYQLGLLHIPSTSYQVLHEGAFGEFGFNWSPDGQAFAFGARNFDQYSVEMAQIYVADTATGDISVLNLAVSDIEGYSFPSWSPDARMLAIQGWLQPFIYKMDGSQAILLSDELFNQSAGLLWSPLLAYQSDSCR